MNVPILLSHPHSQKAQHPTYFSTNTATACGRPLLRAQVLYWRGTAGRSEEGSPFFRRMGMVLATVHVGRHQSQERHVSWLWAKEPDRCLGQVPCTFTELYRMRLYMS